MSSYRYPDVIVRLWGEKYPQRQDSVTDQLWDLIPIAIALGCYDAADHLRRSLSTPIPKVGVDFDGKSLKSHPGSTK